jgi:hypothetical protein
VHPLRSFPAFYGTQRFITALTRALHLYLSCAQWQPGEKITSFAASFYIKKVYTCHEYSSGLMRHGVLTLDLTPATYNSYEYILQWHTQSIKRYHYCSQSASAYTRQVLSPLSLLSLTAAPVPASNTGCSFSCVLKLSLCHRQSDSRLTVHSLS